MGYYHIELSPGAKQLCNIVLPRGKYEYQKITMGVCNSPYIYNEKYLNLRAYIDNALAITKKYFTDHLKELENVLQKLTEARLKVNKDKAFFGKTVTEYLGF